MGNALGSLGDFLGDRINQVRSAISSLSSSIGGWFSNLTTSISGFFSNLSSSIGGWFSNLIDNLGNWFDSIFTTLSNIWDFFDNIVQFIIDLIIPSDSYFSDKNQILQDNFNSKFSWISDFYDQQRIDVNDSFSSGYSIPFIMGQEISFSWYMPYRLMIKGIIGVVFSILIVLGIIKRLQVKVNVNG